MATIGSTDKPYWQPGANEPSPHEQWIQTVNRFVYLASELIGPAIISGSADSVVVINNELNGEKIKVEPVNGQFKTTLPQGRYAIRANKIDYHIVAMPNSSLTLNPSLDFVISSVRDTDSTKTKNVTLTLVANGSGSHTFAVRTSNLTVITPEKSIDLQSGTEQTITWQCTIPNENEPSFAVIVPDGDIKQKKEVAILEIALAAVVEPEVTGSSNKIIASQDTYVDNTAPSTTKNTAVSLFASYAPGIATPKIRDSYLKFDLSRFTPDSAAFVNNVSFQLKAGYVSDPTKSQTLIVRDVNKSGLNVDGLTFDGLAAAGLKSVPFSMNSSFVTDFTVFPGEKEPGSTIAQFAGTITVDQVIEFDVTDYIKWAILNNKKEVNLNVAKDVASDDGTDNRAWFYSLEATAESALLPQLVFSKNTSSAKAALSNPKSSWKVYPSLTSTGTVDITRMNQVEKLTTIRVFSASGSLMKSMSTSTSFTLNVRDFSAGTYFVDINAENENEKHRFVVYN
jgi:hypothetical protein